MVQGRARAFSVAAIFAGLLMIGLPSTSLAAHDLRIYKMEKQVVLDSDEDTDVNVECLGTDRALDGMWRIDHADLDEDMSAFETIATAVDVLEAWSDTPSRYHFSFIKNAIYRVQLKVFITCIGAKTEEGGRTSHAHALTYGPGYPHPGPAQAPYTASAGAAAGGRVTTTQDCTAQPGPVPPGYKWMLITPGFKVVPTSSTPLVGVGRLYRSILSDTTSSSAADSWTWAFATGTGTDSGAAITVSWRCLRIRIDRLTDGTTISADRHKLVKKVRRSSPNPAPLGANGFTTANVNCGDSYKAVVAGFDIDDADTDPTLNQNFGLGLWKIWYLGMDPRPKTRAYRFLNTGSADTVKLAATCLNYRTT
jgi:hypothetical protein